MRGQTAHPRVMHHIIPRTSRRIFISAPLGSLDFEGAAKHQGKCLGIRHLRGEDNEETAAFT